MPKAFDPLRDRHPDAGAAWPGSLWTAEIVEPAPDDGPLDGDADADLVIIGGGYAGLSAALHAARAGASVRLLEAARPGYGCSGRNGGVFRPAIGKAAIDSWIPQWGKDEARALFDDAWAGYRMALELVEAENIDCDMETAGYLKIGHKAAKAESLKRERDMLANAFGYAEATYLSPDEMRARGIGGARVHGGLLWPEMRTVQPLKLALGVLRAARGAGAVVHGASPVVALERDGGGWLARTAAGAVRAKAAILATNGYGWEGLHKALYGKLLPIRSDMIATPALPLDQLRAAGITPGNALIDSRRLSPYWRARPDGRIVYGARGAASGDPATLKRMARSMLADIARLYPELPPLTADYVWGGWVAFSWSFAPYAFLAETDPPLFVAAGYSGSGVTYSLHTGRRAAGVVLGTEAPAPGLVGRAPKAYPLPPLRRIGQAATIALWRGLDAVN